MGSHKTSLLLKSPQIQLETENLVVRNKDGLRYVEDDIKLLNWKEQLKIEVPGENLSSKRNLPEKSKSRGHLLKKVHVAYSQQFNGNFGHGSWESSTSPEIASLPFFELLKSPHPQAIIL
uniref:Uncharacterized protein n=1 Tax=Megaselia scalaris TaxID=36166 RepID=T1GK91_MEGSC